MSQVTRKRRSASITEALTMCEKLGITVAAASASALAADLVRN